MVNNCVWGLREGLPNDTVAMENIIDVLKKKSENIPKSS